MRSKSFIAIVLFLFLPAATHAFTAAEKAEILKIGEARRALAMVLKRGGEDYRDNGNDSNRSQYHAAFAETWKAFAECFQAWGHILNSPGNGGYFPDRETRVQDAFRDVNSCRDRVGSARQLWTALGSGPAVGWLDTAEAWLTDFDTTFDYLDWQPPDYPAVVGPHDDWFTSQRHLHRTMQYSFVQALGNVIGFLGHANSIPAECGGAFAQVMAQYADGTMKHTRGWALFSGLVFESRWNREMDDDLGTLASLVEASQGFRPPEFFLPALGAQYLWSKAKSGDVLTINGQPMKQGVSPTLFGAGKAFLQFVACAGTDEFAEAYVQGNKLSSAAAQPGRALEFVADLLDGWNDHDMPAASLLNFFHGAPVNPPPNGEGVSCDPDTTVEVDGVCVSNVTCPEFTAEMILTSPTEALCQIVTVP